MVLNFLRNHVPAQSHHEIPSCWLSERKRYHSNFQINSEMLVSNNRSNMLIHICQENDGLSQFICNM